MGELWRPIDTFASDATINNVCGEVERIPAESSVAPACPISCPRISTHRLPVVSSARAVSPCVYPLATVNAAKSQPPRYININRLTQKTRTELLIP